MRLTSTASQTIAILALSLFAAVGAVFLHPKAPAWYRVASPEELRWQLTPEEADSLAAEKKVLWVDARSREKFEEGHLPDAILLNAAEWGDLMFQHMDRLQEEMENPVVVYCDTAECGKSQHVALQLREILGMEPVYVLKGDWRELAVAGQETRSPE